MDQALPIGRETGEVALETADKDLRRVAPIWPHLKEKSIPLVGAEGRS